MQNDMVIMIDMEAARDRVLKRRLDRSMADQLMEDLFNDRRAKESLSPVPCPPAQIEVSGEGRVPQEFLDRLMQSCSFRHADRVKVTPPTRTEAMLKRLGLAVVKTEKDTLYNVGQRAEDVLEAELQRLDTQAKTRLTAGIVGDVMDLIDARTPRKDSAWLDGANVKGLMRSLKRDIMDTNGLVDVTGRGDRRRSPGPLLSR